MKNITADDLHKMKEDNPNLDVINVLSHESYRKAHLPDSNNIPFSDDDFVKKVEQTLGGKDKPVVVYCASTECPESQKAAEKLDQSGFEQVYDFESGVAGWQEAGLPLQAGPET